MLINQSEYAYAVGQAVDHMAGGMPAVVVDRSRSANGHEIYSVDDGSRLRHIRGGFLVAAHRVAA